MNVTFFPSSGPHVWNHMNSSSLLSNPCQQPQLLRQGQIHGRQNCVSLKHYPHVLVPVPAFYLPIVLNSSRWEALVVFLFPRLFQTATDFAGSGQKEGEDHRAMIGPMPQDWSGLRLDSGLWQTDGGRREIKFIIEEMSANMAHKSNIEWLNCT